METKKTSLYQLHQDSNAKFVEFAGYQMPIQYAEGIVEEHKFTRNHSGIFDVSHMGQLFIYGDKDLTLSLIHISEPTRRTPISYAVFCLKKKNFRYLS